MYKRVTLFFSFVCIASVRPAAAASPVAGSSVTLGQCYEWAQIQSESLRSLQEDIVASGARARAALGGALPHLNWEFHETWQDPDGVEELESQGFSGFVEKEQTESKFTVEQPLFSGLRESSARAGFNKERERDKFRLKRAALELFERTANAFYAVLTHQTDLENTIAALDLAEDRVKELSGFLRLGKARESELFSAKAYAASLRARIDRIQGDVGAAREELSFLTGRDLVSISLHDQIASPPPFGSLQDALANATERTDLKAQREEVEALKYRVRYEKGFYWPTADLTGNYYTQRATFLDAVDWDVILSVELPIYQGGAVSARVREAMSSYRQALLQLQEMERRALYAIRRTHGDLTAAVQESRSLEEATQAARQSYDSLRGEYKLGLVTNLEVLQALDLLQDQKSARDAARLRAKRLFLQLHVAMDRIPERSRP